MSPSSAETPTRELAQLWAFVLLAYALTWVFLAPWFYAVTVVYGGEPPTWLWALIPLALVGAWGPTVAELIVAGRSGGRAEVGKLLRSLLRWRVGARWILATFLVPPLVVAASVLLVDRGLATLGQFDLGAALTGLPAVYLVALPFGPLGEEIGWRGFALPRLLSRFGVVKASLVLGVVWTFWHVPMMLWFPGAAIPSTLELSLTAVALYLVQTTAEAALMTVLYVRTGGSLLLAILAHLTLNTAEAALFGGLPPLAEEREPAVYGVHVALLAILAVASLARGAPRPGEPGA